MVSMGEEPFPGLQRAGAVLCWPWGRAHNRLVNGPEDKTSGTTTMRWYEGRANNAIQRTRSAGR
jgi:hypothetical protein